MEHTIPYMLETASHTFGDKGYLYEKTDSGWQGYSFSQTRQIARAYASALHARKMHGPMAILAEGRPTWVIAELGIFMLRGFSVPLSIKLSAEEVLYRIDHAQVRSIVCSRISVEKLQHTIEHAKAKLDFIYLDTLDKDSDKQFKARIEARGFGFHLFEDLVQQGTDLIDDPIHLSELEDLEDESSPDDVATVCYTSGTTGNPKGIMLTQGNYYANCRDSLAGFPMPVGMRMFVILPIDHSYAHTIALYAALIQCFTLYFVDARGGAMGILRNISPNMREVKPDLMLSVPALTANFIQKIKAGIKEKGTLIEALFNAGIAARIQANGTVFKKASLGKRFLLWFPYIVAELLIFKTIRKSFGNLKFSIGGGAHLDIKQQEFFKALGIIVFQGYGLTEAGPVVSTNSFVRHKLGTSGTILPNYQYRIVDEHDHDLAPGQKGQLLLRSESIMKGYLYNEVATKLALKDGWLHTGDLGYLDEDGFLIIAGREKALLITADGEKYSPEEIENAIVSSSLLIQQCMLWCDHKNYVSSIITLKEDAVKALITKRGISTAGDLLAIVIEDFQRYASDPSYKNFFPVQWRPACFALSPQAFAESNGMINSTMKMVRHIIMKQIGGLIDFQYTQEGSRSKNVYNEKVLQDGYFS